MYRGSTTITRPPRPFWREGVEEEEEEELDDDDDDDEDLAASAARAAIALGRAPRTSPSPPVLEKGAASAVTKMTSVTFVLDAGGDAGGCCGVSCEGVAATTVTLSSSPDDDSPSLSNVRNDGGGLATLGGALPKTQDSSESTSSALAPSIERACVEAEAAAKDVVVEEEEEEGEDVASAIVFSLSASATRSASRVLSFSLWRRANARASSSGSSVMSCLISFFVFEKERESENERLREGEEKKKKKKKKRGRKASKQRLVACFPPPSLARG